MRRPRLAPLVLSGLLALTAPLAAAGQEATPGPQAGPRPPSAKPAEKPGLPTLAITRKEAIVRAIANYPNLGVARIDVDVALAAIDQARGEFEPFGFVNATFTKNREPSFSGEIVPGSGVTFNGLPPGLQVNPSTLYTWNGGFRVKTELGTLVEARYDYVYRTTESRFALDPSISPSFNVSVQQPLLRGFGPRINRSFVTIAALGHAAASAQFEDAVLSLAQGVEDAYWGYAASIENAKVADQAVLTARKLLNDTKARKEAGTVAEINVISAQAGLASREEQVISAKNQVDNARDVLLRFILPPGALEAWDVDVVLLDKPEVSDVTGIDVDQAIATAFETRPDILAATIAIESERVQLDRAKDDRLPRLDLVGSYTQLGLGDSHHSAHDALIGDRFYDFSLGIQLELPLLGIGPRARIREFEARRRRAEKQREALEQQVVLDIRTAARDLKSAHERIRAATYAVELAERQLEAEQARLENGLATSFDVLLQEEDLTNAKTALIVANLDFAQSRARLRRAQGLLLQDYEIEIQ